MNFDQAFEKVIGHEGGYVNNPADPGGETNFGISKRSYPREDIKAMTLDRAKLIYRSDYWNRAGCDVVPDAMKFHLFDMAVNSGVTTAIKILQRAVGQTDDGLLGPLTLQALQSSDITRLVMRFNAKRLLLLTEQSAWPAFGKGWVKRVASNMMES